MVGHRVSQAELYDDRDVIIQILKLKDAVNDYAGGIIDSIDVVGNDLVIDWADGTSVSLPLPAPTEIAGISASVIGGNLSITLLMSDGSSHTVVTPLNNLMTTDTVQTVTAKKIFGDIEVDTIPAGDDSAVNSFYVNDSTGSVVNNIVHKDGDESMTGTKSIDGLLYHPLEKTLRHSSAGGGQNYHHLFDVDKVDAATNRLVLCLDVLKKAGLITSVFTIENNNVLTGVTYGYDYEYQYGDTIFVLYNTTTQKNEIWSHVSSRSNFYLKYLKKGYGGNVDGIFSDVTMVGTSQGTDPSLDTTTYPDGKKIPTDKVEAYT